MMHVAKLILKFIKVANNHQLALSCANHSLESYPPGGAIVEKREEGKGVRAFEGDFLLSPPLPRFQIPFSPYQPALPLPRPLPLTIDVDTQTTIYLHTIYTYSQE